LARSHANRVRLHIRYRVLPCGVPRRALFLIVRPRWVNVITCIVFGFAVGATPTGAIIWPTQYPELHTSAAITFVRSLFFFGCFGAVGGFSFWVSLIWSGVIERTAAAIDPVFRLRISTPFARPTLTAVRRQNSG
jgi:hypothetical protein